LEFPSVSEEIDKIIQKKEAVLSPFLSNMDELKKRFVNETVTFAADWYDKTAKKYVTKYPEITLSLSEEKIAAMKIKVNELVRKTEKTVKTELDDPKLWWHQQPDFQTSVDQYIQVADKYPEIIDRAVRHALGYLGVILEAFNFNVASNGNSGSFQEFWFDHPTGDEYTTKPYYPHLLQWSNDMEDTLRGYDSKYIEALALYKEIHELKEEKKRQKALTRWDSI
jgi:hypothetical protein